MAQSVCVCPATQNLIGTNITTHPLHRRTVLADMLVQAAFKRARSTATCEADLRGVSYVIAYETSQDENRSRQ